ncbi:hypothetical protein LA76x_0020 [Lysobacter antibioticus]|uniref:Lysozyme inhibitor LprI-like N-terminal domain-containing protein n=1 Tax=Lysobacter antibioticus TaxID=84531 RepID=A0A0S2F3U1_LYSAN|nr:hypothetical protein LA76x_0020 [Lysobacter antibioticus]
MQPLENDGVREQGVSGKVDGMREARADAVVDPPMPLFSAAQDPAAVTPPALASSALFAVTLMASASAFAAPPASAKPSFDCAKAASAVEKAICGNDGLARADAAVGRAYERLRKSLDAQAASGLREDQRWFIGIRDATYDNATTANRTQSLKALLDDRARTLSQIRAQPAAGWVGSWRNLAGGIDVVDDGAGRLKVEANAAHPLDGRWLCDASGSGRSAGAALTVQVEGGERSSLKLTREGAALRVQALDASGKALLGPDYCGHNGSLEGVYFAVPPGSD